MEEIKKLADWIQNSTHLVFFGGAGTSTDSGIKDFRGKNGLYQESFQRQPFVQRIKNCLFDL